jgi:cytoskeleton protein RodZ
MSASENPVQIGLIDGPGTILRRAREAKGLDIAAIASMLHLSEFKIKAIEADDFDSLPEPVFVRGYLRNYARIVDEQVEPVLEAYTSFSSEPDIPEQKLVDTDSEIEVNNNPDLVKIITIVVVVALIAIPIVWWWSDLEQIVEEIIDTKGAVQSELPVLSSKPEEEKEEEIDLPGTIPLELSEIGDVSQPIAEVKSGEERVKATIETKPVVSEIKELELPESQIKPITIPEQPVVAEAKPEPIAKEQTEPKQNPKPVVSKPVSTSKPIPIPTRKPVRAEQGVWFKFVDSGWVKVRDARNRVILIGDHNKGAIKKLGSAMPYKVVLGNSKAVKVEINGKVVDVEKYSSGGVARFTINNGKIEKP